MISDVISEAVDKIRDYQRRYPDIYKDIEAEIEEILWGMDALRRYLDKNPEPVGSDAGVCPLPSPGHRERSNPG